MRSRLCLAIVAAVAASGLLAGCAEERAPINRVQPNALPKSFFVGQDLQDPSDDPQFYTRTQVVDVGYGAAQDGLFTSSWADADLSRVKFQITETQLIARLTYERIADSDHKGAASCPAGTTNCNPGSSMDGVIVAIYPIESHFDIKRDYNPSTGEELNVIVENTTDRPWYEREYMRVDFSKNLDTDAYDFDTLSMIGMFGGVSYEAEAYYVNDPNDPDAPHFDEASGYFDITQKAFAKPQMIDLSYLGWGISNIPACQLDPDVGGGTAPDAICDPVELTMRASFRRITDTDFEPKEWDGLRFSAFGAFTKDRYGYARNYGMSDDMWHRFLSHYNVWERSHYYSDPTNMKGAVPCYVATAINGDPHADADKNGTEDECEAVTAAVGMGGSRCDTFKQMCTLPLRKRTAKPIVWYVTTGSDPEAFEGTDWATQDWDVAMRAGLQAGFNAECHATAGSDAAAQTQCDSDYPVFKHQFDDMEDLERLAKEVDDCRHQKLGSDGNPVYASYYAADPTCTHLADDLGSSSQRALDPGIIAVAKLPEMVVLCHSPVEAGDPSDCGGPRLPAGTTAADCYTALTTNDTTKLATCNSALNVRIGDLRYHTVNNIPNPQDPSAWGIMVDSNDPLSGETISASINVWTYVTSLWSQKVVDYSRIIKGELKVSDVTDGQFIKEWVQKAATSGGGSGGSSGSAGGGGAVPTFTGKQVHDTMAAFLNIPAKDYNHVAIAAKTPEDVRAQSAQMRQKLAMVNASASAMSTTRTVYEARRQAGVGSDMEAQLTGLPMYQLAGFSTPDQAASVDDTTLLNLSSPLRGGDPTLWRELRTRKQLALADKGACEMDMDDAPLGNTNLADILAAKFGAFNANDDLGTQFARAEKMRKYIATRAQYSVIVHEMGHSIGMRHNFVSSADAFSYRPQYWQLRTNDGKVTLPCLWKCATSADCTIPGDVCQAASEDGKTMVCTQPAAQGSAAVERQTLVTEADAANCIGPRWYDPTTKAERDNLIWMWMQDSTMDYAGETTMDMIGLGVYDFAAARIFYTDAVAVFADSDLKWDPVSAKDSGPARSLINKMDNFGGILGIQWSDFSHNPEATQGDPAHYSQLQQMLKLLDPASCTTVNVGQMKPASWDENTLGAWHPVLDGHFVNPSGDGKTYTKCHMRPVEYVPWQQLRMPEGSIDPLEDTWITKYGDYYFGGPSVDSQNRVRVPYGFATDDWADTGNLSVFRHDNGADAYELFDFLITQQETDHIFTNYRRNRQAFSVRVAANRALERYNEKMEDAIKGLGLIHNSIVDYAIDVGQAPEDTWAFNAGAFYGDSVLASSVGFDFFTRQLARPTSGLHYVNFGLGETIARSSLDTAGPGGFTVLTVPDGAYGVGGDPQGAWDNVGFGGHLLENRIGQSYPYGDDYRTEYTMNCGSYYDKAWTPMLLTESVDNFISDIRRDFLDPRYRSVSIADLFPQGYRRWLANNLTNDDMVKGPRAYAVAVPNAQPNWMPRPVVELPESSSPDGLSQFCALGNDAACGAGGICFGNQNLKAPYNSGMCVKAANKATMQTCGYSEQMGNCSQDTDCQHGQKCKNGQCTCTTAAQCDNNLQCVQGTCADADCPSGTNCCQGICSAGSCFIDTTHGVGWVNWRPAEGPQTCFWAANGIQQPDPAGGINTICSGDAPSLDNTLPVDPQVGWEQQKFLIAMTMQYLPENQMTDWLNMMRVWELGKDADPGIDIDNRIELHDPSGKVYVAHTFGTETIFGKTVQRGIAARVLEYSNQLLNQAYDCTAIKHAGATWYQPNLDPTTGQPTVLNSPSNDCLNSPSCVTYMRYMSVPAFMRQVLATYYLGEPGMKGIY